MSPAVPMTDYDELKYKFDVLFYQKQFDQCIEHCLSALMPLASSPAKRKDTLDSLVRSFMHSGQYEKALEWIEERV